MWIRGTYNGDHVSLFILASVAFLFPLHDCGCDAKILVGVRERPAIGASKTRAKLGLRP